MKLYHAFCTEKLAAQSLVINLWACDSTKSANRLELLEYNSQKFGQKSLDCGPALAPDPAQEASQLRVGPVRSKVGRAKGLMADFPDSWTPSPLPIWHFHFIGVLCLCLPCCMFRGQILSWMRFPSIRKRRLLRPSSSRLNGWGTGQKTDVKVGSS